MEASHSDRKQSIWIFRSVLIAIAVILVIAIFLIIRKPDSAPVESDTPSVSVAYRMEGIGELATQSAYITNVQTITNSRTIFGVTVPFTQSKYIYSYNCTVKAGIDFSQVVYIVDHDALTITVTVPPVYITDISVDENSLVVYDEAQNIFSPLKLTNVQESRMTMQEEAKVHAIEMGILDAAHQNARLLIQSFLLSNAEFAGYEIIWNLTETEEKE